MRAAVVKRVNFVLVMNKYDHVAVHLDRMQTGLFDFVDTCNALKSASSNCGCHTWPPRFLLPNPYTKHQSTQ